MNISYHEKLNRGTPEFPLEFYEIDAMHPRYQMQMHWHKDFEIIYVEKGSLNLKLNESEYSLAKGESAFVPGEIMHSAVAKDAKYRCLVFSPSVLYGTPKCRKIVKTYVQSAAVLGRDETIERIFEIAKQKERGFELEIIGLLHAICAKMSRMSDKLAVLPNEKLEKIKSAMAFIEENYASKITLEQLAASCNLSANYFSRYFTETVGQTPFEYITVYRVEAACEMLADNSKSVTEICYSCGFNDLSYFIHIFKKYKGVSPGKYAVEVKK